MRIGICQLKNKEQLKNFKSSLLSITLIEHFSFYCLFTNFLTGPVPGMTDYFYAEYDRSMKMSPYLLALVISDYKYTEPVYSPLTNTLVRVAGPS